MKKLLQALIIIPLTLTLLFLLFVGAQYKSYKTIADERVPNADEPPRYTGEVESVRVRSIPRTQAILAPDCEYVQILYGYCIDGRWTDVPMENYPLRCLEHSTKEQSPYSCAADSHIVQIASYVVICIETAKRFVVGCMFMRLSWEFLQKRLTIGGLHSIMFSDTTQTISVQTTKGYKMYHHTMGYLRRKS